MTLSLYELSGEWADFVRLLTEAEGELTPELADAMARLENLEGERADAYRIVILQFRALMEAVEKELDKLTDKRDAAKATIERLNARMLEYMTLRGTDEVKGSIWKAKRVKSPPRIILDRDPTELPTEFQRVKVEANMPALKVALTEGRAEGLAHEETGSHLRWY